MESPGKQFETLENSQRIGYLIGGFITHTLTIEEEEELDEWVVADEANMQLFEDMTDEKMVDTFLQWLAARDTEGKLTEMKKRLKFNKKGRIIKWRHYAAAACLIAVAGLGIYYLSLADKSKPVIVQHDQSDILPGSPYAELRLPSGKVIKLDGLADTIINNIHISNGAIVYDENSADTLMHEIHIPRKGSYQLVLPDGTKVWLNAESSISYPGAFAKDTRKVSVTGETFFEVAKDPAKPFIVSMDDVTIQAVGTAFNVNGFDKKVTLTEGIIKVDRDKNTLLLKPGQQIETTEWKVNTVDVLPVIAWTKNQFKFKYAKINEVMPLIERWYNAKVKYQDKVTSHLNGTIERNVPVSKVLELLEETGDVHFTISGDTIIVKK